MKRGKYIRLAAILGALAVAIGAFGAHSLSAILESTGRQATFETAVNYHFYHVFAIFGTAIILEMFPEKTLLKKSIWLFFIGIVIFSGSLYTLSLTGINILGAVTPLGGVAFILGWILLFWSFKNPKK